MEAKLRDRRAKTQVLTWEDLWRTIFPRDADIGVPDFQPILEYHEARERFYRRLSGLDYNAMIQLQGALSNSDALDPVEVVRKACHIVDASSLQAPASPLLALEPCMASSQYPSGGLDMGLQKDSSDSRGPEDHL
ncbi:ankyrin repeat [Fusarium albosuccineum]|uniref:Ankyrin repeat n=1 Tax=Fusarium albosuccineum TaxID=1237068 RepID=A0A8H4KJS4_9HYPO|nr:ankyrin repeat [Fusarium albosuccineum]